MLRAGVKLGLVTPTFATRRHFAISSCFSSSKYIRSKPSQFTNDIPVEYGNTYELADQEEVDEHYTKSTWYIFATRSFAAVLCIHALFHLYAYSQGVFDEDVSKANLDIIKNTNGSNVVDLTVKPVAANSTNLKTPSVKISKMQSNIKMDD